MAAPVQQGHLCYLEYVGFPGVIHTRLALDCVDNNDWVICTPDLDLYVEELAGSNPDLLRFWHMADGALPPRVPRNSIYAFAPMTPQQYGQLIQRGQAIGQAERAARGLAALGAAPAVGLAPAAAPAAAGGDGADEHVWVLAEMVKGHKLGEEVPVPPNAPREGDHALVHVLDDGNVDHVVRAQRIKKDDLGPSCEEMIQACRMAVALHGEDPEAAADVRTLSIKYNGNGDRYREFRSSLDDMRLVEFEDFPLEPRTTLDYLRAVSELSESCYGQHLNWVQNSKIPEGDRSVHENETISRAIDLAVRYDCLNLANLASFELLVRRKQLIADAHAVSPGAPSYEGSDYYMGVRHRPGGGIIVPSLQEHVARRMHEESQIQKEKRKLRESKDSAKGPGKGKGGQNNNPSNPPKNTEGGGGKK
eukprot:Skav234713  [mRNA]  locus=scaffold634:71989:73248:+ [translate_table: standard]